MAKKKQDINQSEEIRNFLGANPKAKAKEVVAKLAEQGINVKVGLVYIVKGKMMGRKGRKKKAREMVEKVGATNSHVSRDQTVAEMLKVKRFAKEVGGMKRLKIIVDAFTDE
jgi:hypothetical protein